MKKNTHIYENHPELGQEPHLEHLHQHRAQGHRSDIIKDPLYVIAPVFNPHRYRSRWKMYKNFEKHVLDSGAHLITVEVSYGNRAEVFTESADDVRHKVIHYRTPHEIWLKENMINLAIQQLPNDWKYVAWIDADVQFTRPDWVGETLQKLQHYHIVQMFSVAFDMSPNYIPYGINYGFMHDYINGVPNKDLGITRSLVSNGYCEDGEVVVNPNIKANRWHPGFAWAARRQAIVDLGGLIDWAILGSADDHMAKALINKHHKSVPAQLKEYKRMIGIWEERANKYIQGNVGYVSGAINHYFHGVKKNRKYVERWHILKENNFEPSIDLKRDWNGLYQLTDTKQKLRDQIRQYFHQRQEDLVPVEGVKGFLD